MSEDWQVGDKALCADDRPARYGPSGLKAGETYTVSGRVAGPQPWAGGVSELGLLFEEVSPSDPNDLAFAAERFTKAVA